MFIVADINSTAILGQSACEKLLIRRIYKITGNLTDNNYDEKLLRTSVSAIGEVHSDGSVGELRKRIIKQCEKCFGDLGILPGEYHITIDKNIPPVIYGVRKILYAVLPRHELERMLKMGVIVPVYGPSKWVSSMVRRSGLAQWSVEVG